MLLKRLARSGLICIAVAFSAQATNAEAIVESCPKEPTRFVVLGDSLADGIWASLFRTYARCDSVETLRLTEVSDGLAKTDAKEWLARYAKAVTKLDTRESDVVIIQIGANDITTIREGRARESFGTDAWNMMYSGRADELTRRLKEQVAQVFWLGLPIVGNSRLEGPYQAIASLQKAAVTEVGGVFIDIHEHTMFGTGDFAQNGTYEGRLQQLRASDKVHFTKSGYDLVAETILDDLAKLTLERDRRVALKDVQLQ